MVQLCATASTAAVLLLSVAGWQLVSYGSYGSLRVFWFWGLHTTMLSAGATVAAALHVLQVAIVGRPNVGKSSLMNAWTGTDRAIVTEIAGTTRDVLEAGKAVQHACSATASAGQHFVRGCWHRWPDVSSLCLLAIAAPALCPEHYHSTAVVLLAYCMLCALPGSLHQLTAA